MIDAARNHIRSYAAILFICVLVSIISFVFRPHDCRPTYGPAPYYYNTDLTLWVHLAAQPISNLKDSILNETN